MKLFSRFRMASGSGFPVCAPSQVPDDWPPHLKRLQRAATLALEGLRRSNRKPLSDRESAVHDDQLKMMRAMADPQKNRGDILRDG
jgi:hypothetical protein